MNIYDKYREQTGKRFFKPIYEDPIDNYIELKRRIQSGLIEKDTSIFVATTIKELLDSFKQ